MSTGHVAHVPDPLEDLPTVQVRQADVEHDDVGVALVELADSVTPLGRLRHGKPLPLEQGPQQLTDIGLVLDDKYGDMAISHRSQLYLGKYRISWLSERDDDTQKPRENTWWLQKFVFSDR